MSATATPLPDISTIIERTNNEPPDKCHTWRGHQQRSMCGESWTKAGPADAPGEFHSERECRERGHRHCVVCEELSRQLGRDDIVAA